MTRATTKTRQRREDRRARLTNTTSKSQRP